MTAEPETTPDPPVTEDTAVMPAVPEAETLEALPAEDWRHDTITSFPAITDATPPPVPARCPCGVPGCPDGPPLPMPSDIRALLSCAPGVTSRMWRTRVANGQYDNIPTLWDKAHASTHMPALDRQRAIHGVLAARRHDIRAVLAQNPSLRSDRVLGDGLRDMAARLEAGLEVMLADSAEHHGSDEDREAAA